MEDGIFRRKRARSQSGFLWLRSWRCAFTRSRCGVIVPGVGIILRFGTHNLRGRNAFFQNRFPVGIVVIRRGQNQRRSVVQRNQLLLGS